MQAAPQDEMPINQKVLADARALLLVLDILRLLFQRTAAQSRQRGAALAPMADKLSQAARNIYPLANASGPTADLVIAIRKGVDLARQAIIELEPRATRGVRVSLFGRIKSFLASAFGRGHLINTAMTAREILTRLDAIAARAAVVPTTGSQSALRERADEPAAAMYRQSGNTSAAWNT